MADNNPTKTETSGATPFSLSLDHPKLTQTDAESIRTFLQKYDLYCSEVHARALEVTNDDNLAKLVRPVNLKFCIDVDFLRVHCIQIHLVREIL